MASEKMKNNGTETQRKTFRSLAGRVGRDFCLGCIALIPLAVLIFVFYYITLLFESVGGMIFGLTKSIRSAFIISVIIVLSLIYTGRKLRRREKWLFSVIEQWISRIPVVGGWYMTFRDMVQTFTSGGGELGYLGTAKVPCGEGYIIGFVTHREMRDDGILTTIFVPTSPNPTTGLVFFFPEESVEYIDMTPEKAFTTIISLGMKG